ncbi:fimbrial protein [Parabacteroides distasonis]|uniref:fimbrial protein n=2 Tax=Parabacteroides distasonis TaxID=823 RepID=UPI001D10B20D|nr:fimbrial protein [Parabacteroides distasonis]
MKLRNLLFGTMIACAFAACSNEDDPIVGPDQPQTGENNATLTISVKNVARNLTKAVAEGTQTENEAKITDLTVALYDAETGALVASSSDIATEDATADNDEVQFAGLTEKAKLRAIAFANMGEISLTGTTINNFVSPVYTMPTAGFSEDYLPMSSGLSDLFILQAGKNYYGYNKTREEGVNILVAEPLYLIRNVARIDFKGLSLDMTKATKDVYVAGTATIVPECVFIMHGRTKSNAADMGNGDSWWSTASNTVWGNVSATYAANATDYASGYRGDFVNDDAMFTNMSGSIIEGYKASLPTEALIQDIASEGAASASITTAPKFYVFENPQVKAAREMNGADNFKSEELATEIVVKGTYKLENAKKVGSDAVYNYAEKTAYWPIKIAVTNEMAAGTADYLNDGKIHRNIIYSIDATLAGRGYDDPTVPPTDFVELFVKTKVLDWGNANQSSVVE